MVCVCIVCDVWYLCSGVSVVFVCCMCFSGEWYMCICGVGVVGLCSVSMMCL